MCPQYKPIIGISPSYHFTNVNCIIVCTDCVFIVSLFTCFVIIVFTATEVMTVFVFHEPSQLSALQDNGLPGVVLNSLLMKNVRDVCHLCVHDCLLQIPATREVLSSVPNILSALCLNARGLQTFTDAQPFERLLKVLINPLYLPAMRRRKGTVDQIGMLYNSTHCIIT